MLPERARLLECVEEHAKIEEIARDVYGRFTTELIEGLNLCPFARGSRHTGASVVRVVLEPLDPAATAPEGSALRSLIEELIDDESAEVVQVIFPAVAMDALSWERWAKALTSWVRGLRPPPAVWAVAAFHPELPWSSSSASEAIPLFRRSPDATLQWLRLDALERVRRGRPEGDVVLPSVPRDAAALLAQVSKPGLAEVVAENNHRMATSFGWEALEDRLKDLALEAERRYAHRWTDRRQYIR